MSATPNAAAAISAEMTMKLSPSRAKFTIAP